MSIEKQSETFMFAAIAKELNLLCDVDQDMRRKADEDSEFWDETVDLKNTNRMKEIVAQIGWPTISKVGSESSYNAWLMIQHADHEVDFQKHCLALMKEAAVGEVDNLNVVYLEDRIRVNQKMGQLYGTQFTQINNQHVPRPIDDESNIDTRRAAVGLGPLSEQIALMNAKYPLAKL